MTTPLSDLEQVGALIQRAGRRAAAAETAARADAGKTEGSARDAKEACHTALRILCNAGVRLPAPAKASTVSAPGLLTGPARLDTPAARAFLEACEAAARAGAAWDRERGRLDAEGRPDGWGEYIGEMVETVRRDIFGNRG